MMARDLGTRLGSHGGPLAGGGPRGRRRAPGLPAGQQDPGRRVEGATVGGVEGLLPG